MKEVCHPDACPDCNGLDTINDGADPCPNDSWCQDSVEIKDKNGKVVLYRYCSLHKHSASIKHKCGAIEW